MRRYHHRPACLGSSTFQMVFIASLSWTTTGTKFAASTAEPRPQYHSPIAMMVMVVAVVVVTMPMVGAREEMPPAPI